jgi:hypothetical protein
MQCLSICQFVGRSVNPHLFCTRAVLLWRGGGGGKQSSGRLVDRKLCTLRGVLWECVVKCLLRHNSATWFPCYSMTSHVEWRHDVEWNSTNTICAIDGVIISHLLTRKCVFHPTMLCEEYTVNESEPSRGLLTWSFTLTKSSGKWITAQMSIYLHYILIITIVQSN